MVCTTSVMRFSARLSLGAILGIFLWAPSAMAQLKNLPKQVELINQALQKGWEENNLRPSPQEDDLKWCRRVYLDLIGRIPTFDELAEFAKDKSSSKKLNLVNRLLNDERYTEEYANHWATVWSNVLIGRKGGMEDNSIISREGMMKYLRDSFAQNKPYNDLVYELVTATGTTRPGTEKFNGAANFLAMKVNPDNAALATASVSRVFLGLQVQCTQCHNHPFNQWKQQKFWEFNAFFRQTSAREIQDGMTRYGELRNHDFAGEGGNPEEAEIYYQLRNGITNVAYPAFVDGTTIGRSGYLSQVNRRNELGKLMMQSPFLDRTIVNRMWAHFLGYGFTKPIDDLGPHNPTSFPELFDQLAVDFRENSYDLKQLMVWITMSQPYQLSSRITKQNESDDPTLGETPKFSYFYARQMTGEQLYQSIAVATKALGNVSLDEQARRRDEWIRQFLVDYGNDEGDEANTFNGSISQSLMMFNGDLSKDATSVEPGSFLHTLIQQKGTPVDKVQHLFLSGLSRRPRNEELEVAKQLLIVRKNDVAGMLQDMWWAILNSNEFIFNH